MSQCVRVSVPHFRILGNWLTFMKFSSNVVRLKATTKMRYEILRSVITKWWTLEAVTW
jgi:hypothetical protein